MKYPGKASGAFRGWSRPAWGAWIEIATCQRMEKEDVQSRPAWGAWIEIRAIRLPMGRLAVAPRMGRVD